MAIESQTSNLLSQTKLSQRGSVINSTRVSFKDIQKEVFKKTLKDEGVDLTDNIKKLAQLVKDRANKQYKQQKRNSQIMSMLSDQFNSKTCSQTNLMSSRLSMQDGLSVATDNNQDLKVTKPMRRSFVDFGKQTRRKEFVQTSNRVTCNDNRFNYFDPLTSDALSKNKKVLELDFAIQQPRTGNVFGE